MSTQVHTAVLTALLFGLTGCLSGGGGNGTGGGTGDMGVNGGQGGGGGSASDGPIAPRVAGADIADMTGEDVVRLCEEGAERLGRISARKWCTLFVVGFAEAQAADPESEGDPIDAATCTQMVTGCVSDLAEAEPEPLVCEDTLPELTSEGCAEVSLGDLEACHDQTFAVLTQLTNTVSCSSIGQSGIMDLAEGGAAAAGPACDRINRLCPELLEDDDSDTLGGPEDRSGSQTP